MALVAVWEGAGQLGGYSRKEKTVPWVSRVEGDEQNSFIGDVESVFKEASASLGDGAEVRMRETTAPLEEEEGWGHAAAPAATGGC